MEESEIGQEEEEDEFAVWKFLIWINFSVFFFLFVATVR